MIIIWGLQRKISVIVIRLHVKSKMNFQQNHNKKRRLQLKPELSQKKLLRLKFRNVKAIQLFSITDEYVKAGTTADKLGKLRPAFKKDGSVTAGNASGINDGAAAFVIMSKEKADELGLTPLATIAANGNAGVDPSVMGIGPVQAVKKALDKADMQLSEIDLIEANEAFAAQSIAVDKELEFDESKLNVNGGAIALGHPIGASGARILVTLLHEMKRRDAKSGLATFCIGGGQGVATIVTRP